MSDPPTSPRDVADLLEGLARKIRADPGFGAPRAAAAPSPDGGASIEVVDAGTEPALGEVDVFHDGAHVTVTAETRNADARSVHVSLSDGRLFIGLGEGPRAIRKDLALPAAVDGDAAFATFRNGILDVVLPVRRA